MCHGARREIRRKLGRIYSLLLLCPGIKFMLPGFEASAFTHRAMFLGLNQFHLNIYLGYF